MDIGAVNLYVRLASIGEKRDLAVESSTSNSNIAVHALRKEAPFNMDVSTSVERNASCRELEDRSAWNKDNGDQTGVDRLDVDLDIRDIDMEAALSGVNVWKSDMLDFFGNYWDYSILEIGDHLIAQSVLEARLQ